MIEDDNIRYRPFTVVALSGHHVTICHHFTGYRTCFVNISRAWFTHSQQSLAGQIIVFSVGSFIFDAFRWYRTIGGVLASPSRALRQKHRSQSTPSSRRSAALVDTRSLQAACRWVGKVVDLLRRWCLVFALLPQTFPCHHDRHRTLRHEIIGK